jgi:hypothetical protein
MPSPLQSIGDGFIAILKADQERELPLTNC